MSAKQPAKGAPEMNANGRVWTEAEVRALGVRTSGQIACQIVYGVGRTKAYELLRSGNCAFKVIRVPGVKPQFVVPVSSILRVLGEIDSDPNKANGAPHREAPL